MIEIASMGRAGFFPCLEFDAAFSSSAYMTRSMAPLGELCSMIGLRLLFCSSMNSILYRSPFSTSIWSVDRADALPDSSI